MGALAAGIGLYAAYPMTPASSLLSFMAEHERDMRIVVKHVEDELAAMNMVIGGAFTGARSMCATSGGGLALMTEAFGMAGVSESSVVVMVSQRPGPAHRAPGRDPAKTRCRARSSRRPWSGGPGGGRRSAPRRNSR